jgi:hypothetical protein
MLKVNISKISMDDFSRKYGFRDEFDPWSKNGGKIATIDDDRTESQIVLEKPSGVVRLSLKGADGSDSQDSNLAVSLFRMASSGDIVES